mgnify:CR=1 FL=1
MNLKEVKNASEIRLGGVNVDIELHNGRAHAVTVTDPNGGMLRVVSDLTALRLLVPEPPKRVTRYHLSGRFAGLVDVSEYFDDQNEAVTWLEEYRKRYIGPDEEFGLTVQPVEVEVSE